MLRRTTLKDVISLKLQAEKKIEIDRFIRQFMIENAIPGVSIGIFKDGETIFTQGYGYRDIENGLPMTPDTLFGIGSITKSFTALAILNLIEENKINLNNSVSTILKREPFLSHPDINIGHLLSHSSGIPSADASLIESFYKFGKFDKIIPVVSEDDFFHILSASMSYIINKPGEIFLYNNDMFECLGLIIEKISKKSYAQYIQDLLLSKLDMKRATFSKNSIINDPSSNYIIPYLKDDEGKKEILRRTEFPIYKFSEASGGLYASINEMLRYIEFMLNGAIKNSSVLWKARISYPDGFTPDSKYALGWVIDDNFLDESMIYHGGHIDICCSSIILVPNKNIGVIVGQNSCNGSASIISRYIISLLLGKTPELVIPELKFKKIINLIVGNYISPLGLYKLEISLKDQLLWANIEIDDGIIKAPIIIDNERELSFSLCLAQFPPYPKIKFTTNSKGLVEFANYDRYIYKKK